jgi:sugar phosphate isomerase/epimerase
MRGVVIDDFAPWGDPTIRGWTDFKKIGPWGVNVLRIQLAPYADGQPIQPGQPLKARLMRALDRYQPMIDWLGENNIQLLLCFLPNYVFPPPAYDWPEETGRSLWRDASAQDELVEAWIEIAQRFKDRPGVIFELINEPHGVRSEDIAGDHAIARSVLPSLYRRLVQAIRGVDTRRWIMMMPVWGKPNAMHDLPLFADPRVMYSFHVYSPQGFTYQGSPGGWPPAGSVDYPGVVADIAPWDPVVLWNRDRLREWMRTPREFAARHSVRVCVSEYGCYGETPGDSRTRWMTDVVSICDEFGFDDVYFVFESNYPNKWTFEGQAFESQIADRFRLNFVT